MNIKRYNSVGIMGFGDGTHEDANGTYVKYEDYAHIKDEVERLKIEADWKTPALKIKALEAEVNRLRVLDSLKTVSLTDSTNWKIIGAYAEQKDESEGLRKEVERLQKEVWRIKVFKGMDEDNIKTLKAALKTSPEWSKTLETIDENASLKAELERLRNLAIKFDGYLDLVRHENERLRKAGDAMAKELPMIADTHLSDEVWVRMQTDWERAKEGKPSV